MGNKCAAAGGAGRAPRIPPRIPPAPGRAALNVPLSPGPAAAAPDPAPGCGPAFQIHHPGVARPHQGGVPVPPGAVPQVSGGPGAGAGLGWGRSPSARPPGARGGCTERPRPGGGVRSRGGAPAAGGRGALRARLPSEHPPGASSGAGGSRYPPPPAGVDARWLCWCEAHTLGFGGFGGRRARILRHRPLRRPNLGLARSCAVLGQKSIKRQSAVVKDTARTVGRSTRVPEFTQS